MESCFKGFFAGITLGMVVGGIVVAKNKRLASHIRDFICDANEKIDQAKEMVEDKIEEMDQNKVELKEMNKKSKNQ